MKKKDSFPLVIHGIVSLLLPIPCFLITFVLNAFLALLASESFYETAARRLISMLPFLAAVVFSAAGIWQGFRNIHHNKAAVACMVMSILGIVEFIILNSLLRY